MQILNVLLLVFGFGFVIFWHELGHFLAAKWAGVKVEQFAVGFGQALLSYRKGMGVRVGTSGPAYQKRAAELLREQGGEPSTATPLQLDRAAATVGLSPTEYRLNWLPLGGYVKMLGQDDLDATARSDDPRSYNSVSVPKRMVIVSAGVVMNVILAAALFWALFTVGFHSPPAEVGLLQPGSPAQRAGLNVGDEIVSFDGDRMHDFTKLSLAVPLSDGGEPHPLIVRRASTGAVEAIDVTPRVDPNTLGTPSLGIAPPRALRGPQGELDEDAAELVHPQVIAVRPGETITSINGTPVEVDDYRVLHAALQQGRPVGITLEGDGGSARRATLEPFFAAGFGQGETSVGGLLPRVSVRGFVSGDTDAAGALRQDDVVVAVSASGGTDRLADPTSRQLRDRIDRIGQAGGGVDLTVLRGGELVEAKNLALTELPNGRYGLGIGLGVDTGNLVIAGVEPDSPAARAGLEAGQTIAAVNGEPVATWFDVDRALKAADAGAEVTFVVAGADEPLTLAVAEADLPVLRQNIYQTLALLDDYDVERVADNPAQALWWGVEETRYLILKFYLTLKQIATAKLSPSLLNGPVGIIHTGALLSGKGTDWMIWFLAMISANLAVVNFLPLPIVDGGLFCFLVYEALRGRPPSPKVQYYTQVAGLLLIGGIFLFVTFNDLTRLGLF